MDSNLEVASEGSFEKREKVSPDPPETFSDLERCDLRNASEAIQVEDERSRQQCQCDWEYATASGTQRAHNPLCPVHDPERVVNAVATQRELTRK